MRILSLAVGIAGLAVAGSANAGRMPGGDAIFSSYVTNSLNTNSVALHTSGSSQGGSPAAQEFTVATATMLDSLTLTLSDPTPSDGGSILVYLVPNNANSSLNIPSSTGLRLTGDTLLGTISTQPF